ncbi:MAG: Crp/Fnr family transcriptional regulator [Bacteroidetes bacterium]|nr:MAG: Crp/Fnr family transcriptional regulator [Bacteroidota bacterium]MBL1144708.1 Crp/Fnr family transcriptional regulator [Bacteroidota bacterium]NOG57502.1 Crp/Fnr family transcriptional regulator [Bacteroidota bacterium]
MKNQEAQDLYQPFFEEALLQEIAQFGLKKSVKEGFALMEIGQKVTHMPLMLSGAIKILQEDKEGNDLLLYFIERGDTCAMTLNCCLGNTKSDIRAIAEIDSELLMIPIHLMDEWMVKYPSWRKFVFESYHIRFKEMLQAIDNIAFSNMDERLTKYLLDLASVRGSDTIKITHQEIAVDLHTSRVVVSRLLKKLENKKAIALNRNSIEIIKL